jgi:hypothetical protein
MKKQQMLKSDTIHDITSKMYIYKIEPPFWNLFKKRATGSN